MIKTLYSESEVIVVNDGSRDNTAEAAKDAGAIVYSHPYNIGNGAAIKSGIRIASGEILVFMDGDGQHNPKDIGSMLRFFPEYDMVVGARPKGKQVSLFRGAGNRILNWLASYVAKFRVQDLTSGFRAVKAEIASNLLYLLPNTYSYPTTITLGVLRSGKSLKYVPININKRRKGSSDISIFRDGVRFFMIITKICALYSPFRIFLPISFLIFLVGLSYYMYTYFTSGRFTNMSALLFTTSILVFLMGLISEQITQMRYERSEGSKFD
jgi:glycosyltransferase involved in cell wall biosynthesis